uniref:Helicase ATP-binding domain-containing protein n=1 Tax=Chromera velia CCMP2878 TaxID=1169474 RepID=A0A0G4FCJ2_9ALVE|eukprot:Cvel_16224.t1-p1 / transcript=Cvel_16224.t1 / gene=Cvel_16224 / organism=Chromera_velia_CCMP2878 / gene_product=hypothetical protein / transcript_product=hypothetical protein / location=Cvel_scaffold1240:19444-21449(+) / protein_length=369 / sequence_SO=supercontig / SO=protein_coding / is_pseudo=false
MFVFVLQFLCLSVGVIKGRRGSTFLRDRRMGVSTFLIHEPVHAALRRHQVAEVHERLIFPSAERDALSSSALSGHRGDEGQSSEFFSETPSKSSKGRLKTIRDLDVATHPAECGDLLLDQTVAANTVVDFVMENKAALLRGSPASGKTFLMPAIKEAAGKKRERWSDVIVIESGNVWTFVDRMDQLPSKHDYPRPLVIVDEAHIAWSLPRADIYIKNFPSADVVFVTTAGLSSGTWRTSPETLRDKQLWLSAPSVDKTVVMEWLRKVVGRATTKRTEDEAERLVANTYNICGGHIARIVKFLNAVLKADGISVPLDALENDRSVCGGDGGEANYVFEHPEASLLFEEGSAAFNLGKLRRSKDNLDQELL